MIPFLSASAPAALDRAVAGLAAGGLVVIPTETVYGLAADARRAEAVRRIFAVKGRPADHPLIVHVASASELDHWAAVVPPAARYLAECFWPGPLTLVLERRPDVLDEVTGGRPTVAVRVPASPFVLALLQRLGHGAGVAAPSANRFGRVSPTTAAHVAEDLGAFLDQGTDLIIDGGPCRVGVESTIVDFSLSPPQLLRPGGLSAEAIEAAVGPIERVVTGPRRAPGMLPVHYAPTAQVVLVDAPAQVRAIAGRRTGALTPGAVPPGVTALPAPDPYNGATLAPLLYESLRAADAMGLDVLVVVLPDPEGLGLAVRDRLRRASAATSP